MTTFRKYLSQFRCDRGAGIKLPYTHTSMGGGGSYHIPEDKMPEFYEHYRNEMLRDPTKLHLTERPTDPSPLRVDLDFRFALPDNIASALGAGLAIKDADGDTSIRRTYTRDHIWKIIDRYNELIAEFIDAPAATCYLMEKTKPTLDKSKIKDGVHLVWPDVVIPHNLQHLIRQKILDQAAEMFAGLGLCNDYESVVDKAIIDKNNWMMYGSCKPDQEAYRVSGVYKYAIGAAAGAAAGSSEPRSVLQPMPSAMEELTLVEQLSMRHKAAATATIRPEKCGEIDEYARHVLPATNDARKSKLKKQIFSASVNRIRNFCADDEITLARRLVDDCINTVRAENYEEWIRMGWVLRNIDYRLLDTWIKFSEVSSKYISGECQKIWDRMRVDTLGMGTLRDWAKKDNPVKYNEIMDSEITVLIDKCVGSDGAHFDVARVIHAMYKDRYRFTTNDIWYVFLDHKHRWVRTKEGLKLRMVLSNDVCAKFSARSIFWSSEAARATENRETFETKSAKLLKIANELKKSGYKDSVMKECKCLFTDEKFEEMLDSQAHLLGFENGVYDLRMGEFREGQPDDYISFTTGRYYQPYSPDSEDAQEIRAYLAQVFTNEAVRRYMMDLLACIIDGSIRQEKFYVFTGSGSNSKSVYLQLVQKSIGDYYAILPIALLTQKRAASNAAQAELERTKGRRCTVMQEPGDNERLSIGLMKELTGGDIIQCRGLYKDPVEFRPQFKMIMTCNELPEVPSDDGGTWRRIRVIPFTSKFTDNPDPRRPNEFPLDPELTAKMERWCDCFIAMIIDHHSRMEAKNPVEPMEVRIATESYKKNNDVIGQFVADCIQTKPAEEATREERLQVAKVYNQFKMWAFNVVPKGKKVPDRTQLKAYLEKTFGEYPPDGKGWRGVFYVKPDAGDESTVA